MVGKFALLYQKVVQAGTDTISQSHVPHHDLSLTAGGPHTRVASVQYVHNNTKLWMLGATLPPASDMQPQVINCGTQVEACPSAGRWRRGRLTAETRPTLIHFFHMTAAPYYFCNVAWLHTRTCQHFLGVARMFSTLTTTSSWHRLASPHCTPAIITPYTYSCTHIHDRQLRGKVHFSKLRWFIFESIFIDFKTKSICSWSGRISLFSLIPNVLLRITSMNERTPSDYIHQG